MVLFWYERIPAYVTRSFPSEWILGNTTSGWMTAESFFAYMTTQFYPWLLKNNIEFPVIVFVDGHSSHLSLPLSKFCAEKNIVLISLYPNATHILQPLDVAVFRPLKNEWKKIIDNHRLECDFQGIKKDKFAVLLQKALDNMKNKDTVIKNGFKTCGITPFTPNNIDFDLTKKTKKKKDAVLSQLTNQVNPSVDPDSPIHSNNNEKEEAMHHVKYLEQSLTPETLEDFKNAVFNGSFQVSNSSDEGLFNHWVKVKRLSGANFFLLKL